MFDLDYIFKYVEDLLSKREGFQDEPRKAAGIFARWGIFGTIMIALLFLVMIGIYIGATYLLFRCKGVNIFVRILIFITFHIMPIISPLAFILFSFFSDSCAATAAGAVTAATVAPAITGAIANLLQQAQAAAQTAPVAPAVVPQVPQVPQVQQPLIQPGVQAQQFV